ncbi:Type I Polyketide synthases (Type I PKS), partial [Aspergillus tanneri]
MGEPIAIVGSACRFPGSATSPSKLWDLLHEPRDVLKKSAPGRLNLSRFYHPNAEHHGSTNVPNSYLLDEDHRRFDASFFNINPAEADGMDPQQRILLETVYESMEEAGYTLEQMQNSQTAVYVGVMTGDYYDIQTRDLETVDRWYSTGTAPSILSNRISYCFNLKGPSMTINTACSSSLVALHQAVLGLRSGESKTAIVTGVNVILDPALYIGESKLHMLSPTSRCRMWDKDADGYARGEGCASIIIKPLIQAVADGDNIECVIRGTSVNSDGRSPGITMPSPEGQASLMRQAYQNAGLDPVKDRCQYFECHGTGTQAGDPVEAEAIQKTFFPEGTEFSVKDKMYVGSIKTIIGHLEGCAGLAGILKAAMCIKNRTISPNLHFNELNPNVAPFCDHLRIPLQNTPWPDVAPGSPLRASVNSFGFGGTNAHAIIEGYTPSTSTDTLSHCRLSSADREAVGPLIFSAQTRVSLLSNIKNAANYIRSNPSLNLHDLAWTLSTKRTAFPVKLSFAGADREELLACMEAAVHVGEAAPDSELGKFTRPSQSEACRILGIFTGQGAQWATMGRDLINSSDLFRRSIENCENSLANLPDAPSWSLKDEIMANETSRLSEAAISQPLTTAIQIAVYDLLYAAGVNLSAIVGHSSGEIAAAYAAGIISAEDAIRIAYYRGLHAKLAQSKDAKQPGAMMAVGLPLDAAREFCSQPSFSGRMVVAASNAPSSVTLSGDANAISEAKAELDQRNIFARLLKVDAAYHSHHMIPCANPYLTSLKACKIQVKQPKQGCTWFSSVRGNKALLGHEITEVKDQYWVDNLTSPVLFSQAVTQAIRTKGSFDIVIELGPHHALKGPVLQTAKSIVNKEVPYVSVLKRGSNDVEAASSAMGFVWQHLGPRYIDIDRYCRAIRQHQPRMLKGLPSYSWDHSKEHWKESRISRRYRLDDQQPHPLLGRRAPDDSQNEARWRNILRLNEIPWLKGHQYQGQVLFPSSCYITLAVEAARSIAAGQSIALIEVHDINIARALTLEENGPSIECVTTLRLSSSSSKTRLEADFSCDLGSDQVTTLDRSCTARVSIHLGSPSTDELPPRLQSQSNLAPVDIDAFYELLESMDLRYTGLFRGINSMSRSLEYATASASWPKDALRGYLFHPAALESSFHSIIGAFTSPFSNSLWTTYFPVNVRRVSINPNILYESASGDVQFEVDANVTASCVNFIEGDLSLFNKDENPIVQIEGLTLKSSGGANSSNDRRLFSHTVWESDPFGSSVEMNQPQPELEEKQVLELVERTALYYFRRALREIRPREISGFKDSRKAFYNEIRHVVETVKENGHATASPKWLDDSEEYIISMFQKFRGQAELELLHPIGQALPAILRGTTDPFEKLLEDDVLDRWNIYGTTFRPMCKSMCDFIKRVVHKHPHMDILEIGAGTGGATRQVLEAIGDKYTSYCYTDISADLVEKATEKFPHHARKMEFKAVNIERDVVEQGCEVGKYDMVIAGNVLHATHNLSEALQQTRSLLKPGGYLVLLEITGEMMLFLLCVMGCVPGWWPRYDEGRQRQPGASPTEWDKLLRSAMFSGVDGIAHNLPDPVAHCFSVIVSQAVDNSLLMLREPVVLRSLEPTAKQVLILSGKTLPVSRLAYNLKNLLTSSGASVKVVDSIEGLSKDGLGAETSVISATELDKPLFANKVTSERLVALQDLFRNANNILWLTAGRLSHQPHLNMTVGLGRAIASERPDVSLQFFDVSDIASLSPTSILEAFMRLAWSRRAEVTGGNILWTTEPEVHYDGQKIFIPRLLLDDAANERYNASRRPLSREVSMDQQLPVEIKLHTTGGDELVSVKESSRHYQETAGYVKAKVKFSIPLLGHVSKRSFMWLGTLYNGKCKAIGISEHDSSIVQAKLDDIHILPGEVEANPEFLRAVASHLIANIIAASAGPDGATLLYEPHGILATAISRSSHWHGRQVYFVSKSVKTEAGWIPIHPRSSRRAIERALPKGVTSFIDLSVSTDDQVRPILSSIYGRLQQVDYTINKECVSLSERELIGEAFTEAKATSANLVLDSAVVLTVNKLCGLSASTYAYPMVIDWDTSTRMSVEIEPVSANALFSSSKSYFMVGMTSPLGLSILSWMARSGAQYFILTSRKPHIDPLWLDEMYALGAYVKVMQMDVADKESVRSVYADVHETMPPVVGVCNAAGVLSDKMFDNLSVDDLEYVWGPKVHGTMHLNELFSEPSLNFFILFSSLGSVVGTTGNSSSHAAHLFMSSVVQQRRQKGLAASIINISMVVDSGYVAEQGKDMIQSMKNQGHAPLSEADFLHSFAEAVVASNPQSTRSSDIVIGLEMAKQSALDQARPPWYSNPRLSHFVSNSPIQVEKRPISSSKLSTRERLQSSQCKQDGVQTLLGCFSEKLGTMLRLPASAVDTNVPLLDLGCDSLLAVEIRAWFIEEIDISVPVLSALQSTAAELCSEAAGQFWAPKTTQPPEEQHEVHIAGTCTPTTMDFRESESTTSASELDTGKTTPVSTPWENVSSEFASSSVSQGFKRLGPMSHSQSLIWFSSNYTNSTQYNIVFSYQTKGSFQLERFKRALRQAVSRHESLRTAFFADPISGELMQGVLEHPLPYFKHVNATDPAAVSREFEKEEMYEWRLEQGEVFRTTVVSLESGQHTVIFSYHHIIMDGVSWSLFLRDLKHAYEKKPAPADVTQYLDYSIMQHQAIRDGAFNHELKYWKRELSPLPDPMPLLPFAKVKYRMATDNYNSHTTTREIGADLVDKIKKTSQTLRGTGFHFYLAALQALFARMLNIEHMSI